jgi:Ca2+-binding RTX toxin-like protein
VDAVVFNGANISEQMVLGPNGSRLRIFRDVGQVNVDAAGVERVDLNARGGSDFVTVQDLAGTELKQINVDLAGLPGTDTGDALADAVIVQGTQGADVVNVFAEGPAVVAEGLAARVSVRSGEPTLDSLVVNGVGGDLVNVNGSAAADTMQVVESSGHALVSVSGFAVTVDASAMAKLAVNGLGGDDLLQIFSGAEALPVQLDGGEGADRLIGGSSAEVLLGGPGDDVISGGQGADTIILGDGNDTFIWNPGDGSDVVEGGNGADRLVFNGANINEDFDLSANGGRLRVTRNVALITLDVAGIERVDVNARGGTDRLVVNDLTGTSVTEVNADLAAIVGAPGGDGLVDSVTVQGSPAADLIAITADSGTALVSGLAARVRIANSDGGDQLFVNGRAGLDSFSVDPGLAGLISVITNQD